MLNERYHKACTWGLNVQILFRATLFQYRIVNKDSTLRPGASFVVALIKQSSVEEDESAEYEPRETMTFMHKFLDSIRLQEPPHTDEEMQETTADLGFLD